MTTKKAVRKPRTIRSASSKSTIKKSVKKTAKKPIVKKSVKKPARIVKERTLAQAKKKIRPKYETDASPIVAGNVSEKTILKKLSALCPTNETTVYNRRGFLACPSIRKNGWSSWTGCKETSTGYVYNFFVKSTMPPKTFVIRHQSTGCTVDQAALQLSKAHEAISRVEKQLGIAPHKITLRGFSEFTAPKKASVTKVTDGCVYNFVYDYEFDLDWAFHEVMLSIVMELMRSEDSLEILNLPHYESTLELAAKYGIKDTFAGMESSKKGMSLYDRAKKGIMCESTFGITTYWNCSYARVKKSLEERAQK